MKHPLLVSPFRRWARLSDSATGLPLSRQAVQKVSSVGSGQAPEPLTYPGTHTSHGFFSVFSVGYLTRLTLHLLSASQAFVSFIAFLRGLVAVSHKVFLSLAQSESTLSPFGFRILVRF